MKYVTACLFTFLIVSVKAQQSKGINFEKELTWEQVISKAKAERKNIFMDCYTTWCAPCKRMDIEVYTNDSVSTFMNKNFISVKVQMDKTPHDIEAVKRFYPLIDQINKEYRIVSFPSYLFFSSEGQIIHRAGGFMSPHEFVNMAQTSLDPKEQYYVLLSQYRTGNKDYVVMPYLINMAWQLNDRPLLNQLKSDYFKYLDSLEIDQLYSKDVLEFLGSNVQTTRSKYFKIFYLNGNKVNKVVGDDCFARRISDSIIAREYINKGIESLGANQPNWDSLYNVLKRKFSVRYAKRNILWAKFKWSDGKKDARSSIKYFDELIRIDGLDTCRVGYGDGWINNIAYIHIYGGTPFSKGSSDTNEIMNAIRWMEPVVRRSGKVSSDWESMAIDTYAMLLYKIGRKKEAIVWEEKALNIAVNSKAQGEIKAFEGKIAKMKNNDSMWD